jgi:hypothetical protein
MESKFFPPTLVLNPSLDSKMMKEEVFIKKLDFWANFANTRI